MKRKNLLLRLMMVALTVGLLISFLALAANTTDTHKPEMTAQPTGGAVHGAGAGATKGVLWDNGMQYENLLTAQIESFAGGLDSEPADDFLFSTDQAVNDVHWIGGYWNGPPADGDFDWRITFYSDFGDGTKPGAALATWDFPNSQVNETLIQPITDGGYYSYSVDLPTPLSFSAGTKYWISIQGLGDTAPQSGWAYHSDQILLHQAVFRSVYFSYPNWTDFSVIFGFAGDMCFQLTGEPWPDHKMHFPQLPDLIGWDVNATMPIVLADDWQCSRTGPVTDIHFWGSWKNMDGDPVTDEVGQIQFFQFGIWSNLPVGHPQNPFPYSIPGTMLWGMEEWLSGTPTEPPTLEAWYDPWTGSVIPNDHVPYWQYDFVDIPEPFYQDSGAIYWLSISAVLVDPQNFVWGWKNSRDHFEDDAVYMSPTGQWVEMYEPPRSNRFSVLFDPAGVPSDGGSTNYYGQGWYYYEMFSWWNMWFYDNPFTYEHPKEINLDMMIDPIGPQPVVQFAINWSTDLWFIEGTPGRPPLPEDEFVNPGYIGRQEFEVYPGPNQIAFTLPYNPEWVSIDFRAQDVIINGMINHECVQTSMDLAFVITGEECTPSIDAEKKVWDEASQAWVDSIDMEVCNNVDFLITVLNNGTCDLTNIIVEDFMDASLEFVDASPPPDTINPVPGGTYLEWRFPGPLLAGSSMDVTVTAHVLGPVCHLDSNYVFVHASYEPQAVEVVDEDVAYVHATGEPWPDHKMHYPQLPDPEGWDVVATMGHVGHPGILAADDFLCSESGPITDIHFWGSWLYDVQAPISGFWLSIHDNIPAPPYSMPGAELWSAYITNYEMVPEGQGLQGWYDPFEGWWEHPNHTMYYRYDITDIPEPFVQDSGTIYWLNIMADLGPPGYQGFPEPPLWGWKTSRSPHFEDDAAWAIWTPPAHEWYPLEDPRTGMTLDLAFVITSTGPQVLCGDVNHDGVVNVGDAIYILNYLFKHGSAPVPSMCVGDVNNDDAVNVGDAIYILNYLFKHGGVPDPNCCNPPWVVE